MVGKSKSAKVDEPMGPVGEIVELKSSGPTHVGLFKVKFHISQGQKQVLTMPKDAKIVKFNLGSMYVLTGDPDGTTATDHYFVMARWNKMVPAPAEYIDSFVYGGHRYHLFKVTKEGFDAFEVPNYDRHSSTWGGAPSTSGVWMGDDHGDGSLHGGGDEGDDD